MKTNNSFSLSELNMASLSVEDEKEINGGAIPPAIAAIHEVNILDTISYQIDSFYILDRGYNDFKRLYRIHYSKAFFVVRAKDNLHFRCVKSNQKK